MKRANTLSESFLMFSNLPFYEDLKWGILQSSLVNFFFGEGGGHFEALVIIFVWFVLTLTWPTFLPLTTSVLNADRQLSGIRGVKTRHRGAVGHRGGAGRGEGQLVGVPGHAVQGLGQVCCPLQDDLLEINIVTDINIHTAVSNNIL